MTINNNYFTGKTILITGGTGFLGQALTKEILKQNPHSIRIFSRDEVKHYQMGLNFNKNEKLRHLIGDVRDFDRLSKAMRGVDYVIHTAALKRLDIIEFNTEESIKTNILGTLNLVQAAEANKIKKLVFVSTDKACSPVNTYGACKFVSERIVTNSNYSNGDSGITYTCVRYGNVINSTGSIVPFLMDKIKSGNDFPLTDTNMTRFLITEEEAVNLIFNAFQYGIGGEVFIPKLPSAKIPDLMDALKTVNGTNNKIHNIGLRPGEKIHELMINEMEGQRIIDFDNMYVIKSLIEEYKHKEFNNEYIKKGKEIKIGEYSSETETISKDEIIKLFGNFLKI